MSELPMTPHQARAVMYTARENHVDLGPDAHHALETIAGMTEEWGVEYTGVNHGHRHTKWCQPEDSDPDVESQARHEYRMFKKKHMNPRLVRRYVTKEVDDE